MAPRPNKIRVAIVGGGISGISTAIRLKRNLGDDLDLTVSGRARIAVPPCQCGLGIGETSRVFIADLRKGAFARRDLAQLDLGRSG
jgi:flavin-dependent dehydrogenase